MKLRSLGSELEVKKEYRTGIARASYAAGLAKKIPRDLSRAVFFRETFRRVAASRAKQF
jgi:hypothetical protein